MVETYHSHGPGSNPSPAKTHPLNMSVVCRSNGFFLISLVWLMPFVMPRARPKSQSICIKNNIQIYCTHTHTHHMRAHHTPTHIHTQAVA